MNTRKSGFRLVVGLLVVLGQLAGPRLARGFTYYITIPGNNKIVWPSKEITYTVANGSFPPGSPSRTALVKVLEHWNESPGDFRFPPPVWDDSSVGVGNGQSEIWFTPDPVGAVHWGQLQWNGSTAQWIESDVAFSPVPWPDDPTTYWAINSDVQSFMIVYGGPREMWEQAAIHEIGHGMGIAHTNNTFNIMGDHRHYPHTNGGKVRTYVGEDAGNASVFLYGPTTAVFSEDVGVSHWKYKSASGEYSAHEPTQVYSSDGATVISSSGNFEGDIRRYDVKAGSTYRVQFTYENNGLNPMKNVSVGYYISTNNYITTCDRRFSSHTRDFYRDKVFTMKQSLTIPADLTVGQTYYLGVIVDYKGQYFEFSEDNNATYIPIKIIP